jgi:hypothetical protein
MNGATSQPDVCKKSIHAGVAIPSGFPEYCADQSKQGRQVRQAGGRFDPVSRSKSYVANGTLCALRSFPV